MELETVWTGDVHGPSRGLLWQFTGKKADLHEVIPEAPPLTHEPKPFVGMVERKTRTDAANAAVLALVSETEWRSTTAISEAYGRSSGATAKVLLRLERAGVIKRFRPTRASYNLKMPSLWKVKA